MTTYIYYPHSRQPRRTSIVEKLRWGRMRGRREKYHKKYCAVTTWPDIRDYN